VLLAAVGAILLIGCANLANLTLARGAAREREIAVRASLGAGSWRLIRQLLTENLLVAGAGGALGLALGYAMIRGLIRLAPPFSLPSEADVSIDPTILLFTLGISLLTALLFGLAPAIHATRVDPASSMKEGGRSATSGAGRARLRSALIVSEVALAFVLLAGAGLLVGSFFRMLQVDTGFTSDQRDDCAPAHRPRPLPAPRATPPICAAAGRAPARGALACATWPSATSCPWKAGATACRS
jgi:putative ABC transport system permease protein